MPSYKAEYKMSLPEARAILTELTEELTKRGYTKVEVMGSIRRQERWIGDIDLIILGDTLHQLEGLGEAKERGESRWTIVYKGQQVNIFKCKEDYWGAMQLYLTGPKGSTVGMRMKARKKNYTLNQYGLFDKDGKKIAGETEEGIFIALDHLMKPPHLRGK